MYRLNLKSVPLPDPEIIAITCEPLGKGDVRGRGWYRSKER